MHRTPLESLLLGISLDCLAQQNLERGPVYLVPSTDPYRPLLGPPRYGIRFKCPRWSRLGLCAVGLLVLPAVKSARSLVGKGRLELPRLAAHDPKSCVYQFRHFPQRHYIQWAAPATYLVRPGGGIASRRPPRGSAQPPLALHPKLLGQWLT